MSNINEQYDALTTVRVPHWVARALRFFSLEPELTRDMREFYARDYKKELAAPQGLRSFIEDKRLEIDNLEARVNNFLIDIEIFFGDCKVYLNREYQCHTSFQNIERHANARDDSYRRLGIKWYVNVHQDDGEVSQRSIMFAYTESDQGIRVDFITNAVKGDIEVMNPDADLDEFVSIEVDENEETLRTVRRYADHAAFRKAKNPIPEWFKRELENLVPIPTEG